MQTIFVSKALMLDSAGHMLILRRSATHPSLAHAADLPGGIIDEGEEPGQALIREIQEETGLQVPFDALQPVYAGTNVYQDKSYEDGSYVRLLYIVRLDWDKPEVTISWEHESAEWLDVSKLGEIETEFHTFYKDALHHIRTNNLIG